MYFALPDALKVCFVKSFTLLVLPLLQQFISMNNCFEYIVILTASKNCRQNTSLNLMYCMLLFFISIMMMAGNYYEYSKSVFG